MVTKVCDRGLALGSADWPMNRLLHREESFQAALYRMADVPRCFVADYSTTSRNLLCIQGYYHQHIPVKL